MRLLILLFALLLGVQPAWCQGLLAGETWNVASVVKDPFTRGHRVHVEYPISDRSAVAILCDTSQSGLTLRLIPGFPISDELKRLAPETAVAIDDVVLFSHTGVMYVISDNLAMVQASLELSKARQLVTAMAGAKSQIAFKDGISSTNHLLGVDGAANASSVLLGCLTMQEMF